MTESRSTPPSLHEKLKELAGRLEGDDAATVFAAAFATAPGPVPTMESLEQLTPGYFLHMRRYG